MGKRRVCWQGVHQCARVPFFASILHLPCLNTSKPSFLRCYVMSSADLTAACVLA